MKSPVWSRLPLIAALIPSKRAAQEAARRWTRAAAKEPELQADLVRLGGLLSIEPVSFDDGYAEPLPMDPLRQAYEKGRADLARQLLALMGLSETEFLTLMEDDNA